MFNHQTPRPHNPLAHTAGSEPNQSQTVLDPEAEAAAPKKLFSPQASKLLLLFYAFVSCSFVLTRIVPGLAIILHSNIDDPTFIVWPLMFETSELIMPVLGICMYFRFSRQKSTDFGFALLLIFPVMGLLTYLTNSIYVSFVLQASELYVANVANIFYDLLTFAASLALFLKAPRSSSSRGSRTWAIYRSALVYLLVRMIYLFLAARWFLTLILEISSDGFNEIFRTTDPLELQFTIAMCAIFLIVYALPTFLLIVSLWISRPSFKRSKAKLIALRVMMLILGLLICCCMSMPIFGNVASRLPLTAVGILCLFNFLLLFRRPLVCYCEQSADQKS